jgi:hypothetical protein
MTGIATVFCALAGCAGQSAWQRNFEPGQGVVVVPAPKSQRAGAPVSIRRVPWQRLDEVRGQLESELAGSDVPLEEWPPDRRADADARLLRALQVTRDPSAVRIIGVSEFRTTDFDRASEADLRQLALDVGGDTVVWSSRHTGKADRIVQEPVTGTSWTWTGWYGRGGRPRTVSESTTTFVPVRVSADQYEFVAFVLLVR